MAIEPVTVTLTVPTKDRPASLAECLQGLARAERPDWVSKLEIVVVDDGSSAENRRAVRSVVRRHRDVRLIELPGAGPASARNAGASVGSGDLLAFLDDDCVPAGGWLAALLAPIRGGDAEICGGPMLNARRRNACSEASQLVIDTITMHYNRDPSRPRFLISSNLAASRQAFEELGGFDERFQLAGGEDREFSDRALRRGLRLRYVPEAPVDHHHAHNWSRLWRQHRNYGRGTALLRKVRADGGLPPPAAEPGLHLELLQGAGTYEGPAPRGAVAAATLLTQIAYVVGAVAASAGPLFKRGTAAAGPELRGQS